MVAPPMTAAARAITNILINILLFIFFPPFDFFKFDLKPHLAARLPFYRKGPVALRPCLSAGLPFSETNNLLELLNLT
jgi:hypothetical protein